MYRDVEKKRAAWRAWYHNNKDKARKHRRKTEAKKNEWFRQFKATLCCVKCGFSHPGALDFHHREKDTKEFDLGIFNRKTKKQILAEIEKCDVLCANCHRILHFNERSL